MYSLPFLCILCAVCFICCVKVDDRSPAVLLFSVCVIFTQNQHETCLQNTYPLSSPPFLPSVFLILLLKKHKNKK